MSDKRNLPNDYNRDDDVPFRLPKEEDALAKAEAAFAKPAQPTLSDEELRAQDRPQTNVISGSFEVLSDVPDVRFQRPGDADTVDPDAMTQPYTRDETDELVIVDGKPQLSKITSDDGDEQYDDNDVPFRLPPNDGNAPEGRIINKLKTMPNTPHTELPHAKRTLPGSGGLDPNPDNAAYAGSRAAPTMPHPRVSVPTVQAPTVQSPAPDARYRPPTQYAAPTNQAPPPPTQAGRQANVKPLPPRRPAGKRRFRGGFLAIFAALFVTFCGGLTCVTTVGGLIAYARIGDLLEENIARVDDYDAFQSTFLYDRNGQQLYEVFNEGRRTEVNLADIPQAVIQATISIEDDSFYQNVGIDVAATTVALMGYLGINDANSGGSTITQQLVRNVLFDPEKRSERSAARKAEEIGLAIAMTGRKTKDEILELYLNEIYYGSLAYGIEAAAQVYFGKSASALTLGESALLAGLPQAPAELNPLNPDPLVQQQVEDRWRLVLEAMIEEGYITSAQRDEALRAGLAFNTNSDIVFRAPHFTVFVQGELETLMTRLGYTPEAVALGGLRVYTTLDLRINDLTQQSVRDQVSRLSANNVGNGAVVILKPVTGEIMAMVGSQDYYNDGIDGRVNVTISRRQPGSTMKAFTYAAGLERGMTPGDVIWDTRTRIGLPGQAPYEPRNYDGTFHGPMNMRYALANSYNIPAVQTLRWKVGVDYLLSFVQRFDVQSLGNDASIYGLSLTLGGGDITALELTRGYTVFANQGQLVQTQSILCILDNDNDILYQYENSCPSGNQTERTINETRRASQVLDPRIAFVISDILSDNAARSVVMGSNSPLRTDGITSAVKTGTTNDVKDNWTVGYTRNVAVGVWVGNSRGEPMVNSSGLTGAAPIWNDVLTRIYADSSLMAEFAYNGQLFNDQFELPPGISQRSTCNLRALQDPAPQCQSFINEWFLDGPAGVPDGSGGLIYPAPLPPPSIPTTGDYILRGDAGTYQVLVQRLPDNIGIQLPPDANGLIPPSPRYCRVTVEQQAIAPGAQPLLFLEPPPDPSDSIQAENYARAANLAFMPSIQCSPELLGASGGAGPIVATAIITAPQPGQVIPEGGIQVIGTVQFDPAVAKGYKLDIRGGQFPNWTTIGDVHFTNNIFNGQLEFLAGPPGLIPGTYELQLIIIANDSSTLQTPYVVPFVIQ
ncbi:MAG: transglycosylase domain-containing protein [Armatimonadetes bacterium]|nr:transglycosylase domain-containing protein [Anaerolineae bacterium]